MDNKIVNLESVLDSSNSHPNDEAFNAAEKKRYEKLQNAPQECGPSYADLDLNGVTMQEILGD